MLNPQQAQEQLQKLYRQELADQLWAEAKKLTGPTREAAGTLLGRSDQRETLAYHQDWPKARARASACLEKASPKERAKLFEIMFGQVAAGAELAWNYLPRLTYQQASHRRPFRVRNRPELFRERRFDWLQSL